jgi:hypothetical protein
MHRLRRRRARRAPALIAALGLFLAGTNYCVIAGLAGNTRMACLTVPSDAAAAALPPCHRTHAAKDSDSQRSDATPSCCPHPVVAPVAPTLDKADAMGPPVADALVAALAARASPPIAAWHGHRPAPDGEPPTRLARASAPARAPPLA